MRMEAGLLPLFSWPQTHVDPRSDVVGGCSAFCNVTDDISKGPSGDRSRRGEMPQLERRLSDAILARSMHFADETGWSFEPRKGSCYHSPIRGFKTETLIAKLRDPETSSAKVLIIAYELSFRDPASALSEVKALVVDPRYARRQKSLRVALHHVADAETARSLLDATDFDPDALHLNAFAALLDDYVTLLPTLNEPMAEARLRKLGFLSGSVPNPIVGDNEDDAPSTFERYTAILVRFLSSVFASPSLAAFRPELAEHLRQSYAPAAYLFLFERWAEGQINATAAIAAIPRVGWGTLASRVGELEVQRLTEAFVHELPETPSRFESSALENGLLPQALRRFPTEQARDVALVFLATPRLERVHAEAAAVLLEVVPDGPALVVDHARTLAPTMVAKAAARLSYDDVLSRLKRAGVSLDHPALTNHPDAPPDRTLVASAVQTMQSEPGVAFQQLAMVARDPRHPDSETAFARILDFSGSGVDPSFRRFALHALGVVGDNRARAVLEEGLSDPAMSSARMLIESALGNLK